MTERKDNVHWFGAEKDPAIVFNFNASGTKETTFDPIVSRKPGRYYVDPVSPVEDGRIVARHLSKEEAHGRFERHPLSFFEV